MVIQLNSIVRLVFSEFSSPFTLGYCMVLDSCDVLGKFNDFQINSKRIHSYLMFIFVQMFTFLFILFGDGFHNIIGIMLDFLNVFFFQCWDHLVCNRFFHCVCTTNIWFGKSKRKRKWWTQVNESDIDVCGKSRRESSASTKAFGFFLCMYSGVRDVCVSH